MLQQYLMGLYDSECVTHGTRRPSGGHFDKNDITLWLGADNNVGYEPLTDEEVITSFLPDVNESDAEEADGDIEDPVMSHGDAVTKLNELMVYFERQAETSPAELLMLKRLRNRTARKRQTTLAQPKLTEFFYQEMNSYKCTLWYPIHLVKIIFSSMGWPIAMHLASKAFGAYQKCTMSQPVHGFSSSAKHQKLDQDFLGKFTNLVQTTKDGDSQRASVQQFPPACHTFYRVDPPEGCRLCEEDTDLLRERRLVATLGEKRLEPICSFSNPDAGSTYLLSCSA
ncbi:hypothetical protein J6590_055759 [Homalodisca vitripennis]|nr:hypothetical protein J6590_055759 [Homalodisca vitripennis]